MSLLWSVRSETVQDREGNVHPLSVRPYNNLDCASSSACGPSGHFGIRAEIGLTDRELVDVWLLCDRSLWLFFAGGDDEDGNHSQQALESRRKRVLEEFLVKVKSAYRNGRILPGDEVHVKLGPDADVPAYGPDWRRALHE